MQVTSANSGEETVAVGTLYGFAGVPRNAQAVVEVIAAWDEGGEETVAQVLRFKLAARADDSNCLSAEDPRANNRVTVHDVCAVDAVRIVMGAVAQAIHIAGINCEAGICVGSHGRSFRSVSR